MLKRLLLEIRGVLVEGSESKRAERKKRFCAPFLMETSAEGEEMRGREEAGRK